MYSVHVSIYGSVQRVGYRKWVQKSCQNLSIYGWIRNSSDGSIECFFQGDKDVINTFLMTCWEGSPNSEVEDLLEKESFEEEELTEFKIL